MSKSSVLRQVSNEGLHRAASIGDIEHLKTILETGEINVDCQLETGKHVWTPRNLFKQSKSKCEDKFSGISREDKDYLIPAGRFKRRVNSRQSNSPRLTWRGRSLLRKVPEEKSNELDVENIQEDDAISIAAKDGMSLTLQTLLETGGSTNIESTDNEGFTPLMRCASRGYAECLQLLINFGANVMARTTLGSSPLHLSAANNHAECVKRLIEAGSDVDIETKYGATPLIMAAKEGNPDCVKLLIENHANVNVTYRNRQTALLFAAEGGHEECISLLIEAGAEINRCNNQGVTPLMRAIQHRHDKCALTLLEHGAKVDDADLKWRTALHYASEADNPKAVRYLLDYGADINAETKGGNTALKYALRSGHYDCARVLEKRLNHDIIADDLKMYKQNSTTPGCLGKLLACSKPLISE